MHIAIMSFSIVKSLSGIVILVYTVGWLPGRWDNITVAAQITMWTCIKDPWLDHQLVKRSANSIVIILNIKLSSADGTERYVRSEIWL